MTKTNKRNNEKKENRKNKKKWKKIKKSYFFEFFRLLCSGRLTQEFKIDCSCLDSSLCGLGCASNLCSQVVFDWFKNVGIPTSTGSGPTPTSISSNESSSNTSMLSSSTKNLRKWKAQVMRNYHWFSVFLERFWWYQNPLLALPSSWGIIHFSLGLSGSRGKLFPPRVIHVSSTSPFLLVETDIQHPLSPFSIHNFSSLHTKDSIKWSLLFPRPIISNFREMEWRNQRNNSKANKRK